MGIMIYWRLGSVPELRRFPHEVRVGLVNHWRSQSPVLRKVEGLVAIAAFLASMYAAVWVTIVLGLRYQDVPFFQRYPLVLWGGFVVIPLIVIPPTRVAFLRLCLRHWVRRAWPGGRAPICYKCGYDLRGSTGKACPECGFAIPRVDLARFPKD